MPIDKQYLPYKTKYSAYKGNFTYTTMKFTLRQVQKIELKDAYNKILDQADRIDEILEGSIFRDTLYELVVKQADEFRIKLGSRFLKNR